MKSWKFSKGILVISAIVLLGLIVRGYKLTSSPGGLYIDEVSIGYNAYSILLTGKDEHGKILPVFFEAFGEYKMPAYIYFTVLSQFILGPSDLAVRLPALILGTFTIILVYLWVKELLIIHPQKKVSEISPYIAAFLLAISPWFYMFSRPAHETTTALFFEILGLYLFIRAVNKKSTILLIWAFAALVLTFYGYYSAWVVVPILMLLLVIIFFRNFKLFSWIKAIFISGLLLIPFIYTLTSRYGMTRSQQISIIYQPVQKIIPAVINSYWINISPKTLFIEGNIFFTNPHKMGLIHLLEFPFILTGFIFLIFQILTISGLRKNWLFLTGFLIAGFLPASLAIPNPHALREFLVLPATVFISAYGVALVMTFFNKKYLQIIFISIYLILILISFTGFWDVYHNKYVRGYEGAIWQVDKKKILENIFKLENNFSGVYINKEIPVQTAAWYLKFQPAAYQKGIYSDLKGKQYLFADSYKNISLIKKADYLYIGPDNEVTDGVLLEKFTDNYGYRIWKLN